MYNPYTQIAIGTAYSPVVEIFDTEGKDSAT